MLKDLMPGDSNFFVKICNIWKKKPLGKTK